MSVQTPNDVIETFGLQPHPFDGWFARIEAEAETPVRFHYLIRAGELAPWHLTGGQMVITHIDGAPLALSVADGGRTAQGHVLYTDRERSCLVSETEWRTWESLGRWTLLIVSVEREEFFTRWQLAPDDWHPEAG